MVANPTFVGLHPQVRWTGTNKNVDKLIVQDFPSGTHDYPQSNKKPIVSGGLNPSEKYYSIGMIIPNIWENKKCSKPPTSQLFPVVSNMPLCFIPNFAAWRVNYRLNISLKSTLRHKMHFKKTQKHTTHIHIWITGVGKCPNWTSPYYWGYHIQQIWLFRWCDSQIPNSWDINPLDKTLRITKVAHQKKHVPTVDWLVVGPPLWKIWKSIGMISNPILMGK